MKKIIKELRELKKDITTLLNDAKKVRDTCSDINKSWSGSCFTTHAKYYFKDYEEPSSKNRFSIEWGLINGVPNGWIEKSNEEVTEEIELRTKVSLSDLKKRLISFDEKFNSLQKKMVLALIKIDVDTSDIENFKLKNSTDYFNEICYTPSMTRDVAAISSGKYIVPHLYFQAIALYAISIPEQIEDLIFKINKKIKTSERDTHIEPGDDFWNLIHPLIRKVSEKKFKNAHYMDAVRSAFIEFNDKVKQKYKADTGIEEDGMNLMKLAFGDFTATNINFPQTIKYNLVDQTTSSGRNFQRGFSLISSGAMLGLRNPRAHANPEDDKEESIHLIFLASWLMQTYLSKK